MSEANEGIFEDLYNKIFKTNWPMWVGAIILSLFSITLFAVFKAWGQSGGLDYMGRSMFGFHDFDFLAHPYSILGLTTFIGALMSAFFARQFKLSIPPPGELVKGLVGGLIMGVGCILGMGCTIGSYYTGIPQLSAGALIFTLGLFIGVYGAVWYLSWELEKYPGVSDAKKSNTFEVAPENKFIQPVIGLLILIGSVFLILSFDNSDMYEFMMKDTDLNPLTDMVPWGLTGIQMLAFATIGLAIGFVLQRSQFCTVRSIRDPFMTGNATATTAVILGMLVGLFGFTILIVSETVDQGKLFVFGHFWGPAIIGGILFGFGMTLAGGCAMGSLWRSGEGQTKNWLAVFGLIFGAALTTEYIKDDFLDLFNAEAKYLPTELGNSTDQAFFLSVLLVLAILALWYWVVKWNERTEKLVVE